MNSDLDEKTKKLERKKISNIAGFVVLIISIAAFSYWILTASIDNHYPIVSTMWFIITLSLSMYSYYKLKLYNYSFWGEPIAGAIFMSLFFVSYLVYLLIKLIGLDLLIWTF